MPASAMWRIVEGAGLPAAAAVAAGVALGLVRAEGRSTVGAVGLWALSLLGAAAALAHEGAPQWAAELALLAPAAIGAAVGGVAGVARAAGVAASGVAGALAVIAVAVVTGASPALQALPPPDVLALEDAIVQGRGIDTGIDAIDVAPGPSGERRAPGAPICRVERIDGVVVRAERVAGGLVAEVDLRRAGRVAFGQALFPGWTIRVDGAEVRVTAEPDGSIGADVPRGEHRVEAAFEATPVRRIADGASVLGLCAALMLVLFGGGAPAARSKAEPRARREPGEVDQGAS